MKNIIALIAFVLVSFGHSAPVYSKGIQGNAGQAIPLFGAQRNTIPTLGTAINLDTSEIDTSYYFFDLIQKPVVSLNDTVGWLHYAYKDSTGTDSCRVRVIWYGNSRPDGLGIWSKIDSVTASASGSAASAYQAATPTAIVNAKGYGALMFTIGNPSSSAVGLKSAAKDVIMIRRERIKN